MHALPPERWLALAVTFAWDSGVGLTPGTSANVLFRAESRPAGLQAQQAQEPAVVADDSGPPPPGRGHRLAHVSQAGPGRHGAARESSQRRSGSIRSLAPADVVTVHDRLQVTGRADDQRGMDMIVAEEVAYLTDGGGQRMSCGSREHRLGGGAHDLIHRSRIRTAVRTWWGCRRAYWRENTVILRYCTSLRLSYRLLSGGPCTGPEPAPVASAESEAAMAGIAGAELAGSIQLWEWIGDDGATTFSY